MRTGQNGNKLDQEKKSLAPQKGSEAEREEYEKANKKGGQNCFVV